MKIVETGHSTNVFEGFTCMSGVGTLCAVNKTETAEEVGTRLVKEADAHAICWGFFKFLRRGERLN